MQDPRQAIGMWPYYFSAISRLVLGKTYYYLLYCNSDWAGYPMTRRSITGYFVMLDFTPIS